MSLDDLFREVILDHYKNPHHFGELPNPTVSIHLKNPSCGDSIDLQLKTEGDRVVDAAFRGQGCSISMASASMLTDAVRGKTVEEAKRLLVAVQEMLRGAGVDPRLGDLAALEGVSHFPVRVKCALLAWEGLDKSLRKLHPPAGK